MMHISAGNESVKMKAEIFHAFYSCQNWHLSIYEIMYNNTDR